MPAKSEPVKCQWKKDPRHYLHWITECGYAWWSVDHKRMNCPHCGKPIEEVTDGER